MSTRDEYAAKMKKQIDEMNSQIDALEKKAKQASGQAEKKYDEQLAKLRQQSKEASAKLDELKSAGESAWQKAADEVEKVANALRHSFNYFKSQL